MKRTIKVLTAAAASGLLFASTVQAARIVEQRVTTTMREPAMIGERTVTTTQVEEPVFRGPVVSGTTLAGRREVRSNDAIITPSGDGRVMIQDGRGTRTIRPRGFLNPGSVDATNLEDDD